MEIVTPYNSKGGIGKSTIALALAACIKTLHPELRVLFVDATQDQGSHSVNLAPSKERAGLGLGAAVGEILMHQKINFDLGMAKAKEIVEKALTPVCIRYPDVGEAEENTLIDFLPCAATLMSYHGMGMWSQMQDPSQVIGWLFEALGEDRWDWVVVDLPGTEGGIAMRSFLPRTSAVTLPMDVRHKSNFNGVERTLTTLRNIPHLKIAGFIANFYDETSNTKKAMKWLNSYSEEESLPILASLADRVSFGSILDVYDIELPSGRQVVGGGIYHLLKHDLTKVKETVRKAIPDIESMTRATMKAALDASQELNERVEAESANLLAAQAQ